ncbi:MAG: hypothetical protein K6F49_05570 [Saccharofermentans sp.]|nr:hypothetical protein [Saccharofermentans sp.]
MKKKSKWPFIIIGGVVIAIIGGMAYLNNQMEKVAAQMALPASAQVEAADIFSTVSGGGYIAVDESMDIKIPADLVIDEYLVEVGDMVEAGEVIANIDPTSITSSIVSAQSELDSINKALEDTSDMTTYEVEEYNTRKDFLNAKIEILTAYYMNPVIVATESGVISAVGNGSSDQSAGMSIDDYADILIKGENEPSEGSSETSESASASEETTTPSEESTSETSETTAPSESTEETAPSQTQQTPSANAITDLSSLSITAPVAGEAPQSTISETDTYTGIITWMPAADTFAPGTPYTATVTLTPKSGYTFVQGALPELSVQGATGVIPLTSNDGNYVAMVVFPATEGEAPAVGAGTSFELPEDFDVNQFLQNYAGGTASLPTLPTTDYAALYNAATASQYSALAAAYSSGGSLSVGSGRPSSNTSENLVVTIAYTDTAILTISIDEMDILGIHEGQEAVLSFVAIPGQEYTGEIIHVSNIADGSTGNTKYDVDILVQMDENMRFGMSADATITIAEAHQVPSIPMEALQQSGSQTFVYTSIAEDGTLTGEVPVTTGVSDGLTVEIVSGVSMGDTVYYEKNDENPLAAFM